MRQSKTLEKLRRNELVRICGLGHFIPSFVRHAAHFGFDCIWLDLEHRAMDDREIQSLLAFCHLYDVDCMLRPPTLEKTRLYRYLEDGATGLMIPHVSTSEKAEMLVQSVKFPPLGDRGIDGAGLDSDFLVQGGGDYTERANRETFLVVQLETPQAIENAESIAAVDGVDGLFIGPGDLGLRLKYSDSATTLDECIARVATAAANHGKAWGRPAGSVELLKTLYDQGARLLAYGGEFMAIMKMLEKSAADFDTVVSL
jgi:2-keto-3-deoxy-L-rhamnonate aldolase RhmA